jgi:hypothetical protein
VLEQDDEAVKSTAADDSCSFFDTPSEEVVGAVDGPLSPDPPENKCDILSRDMIIYMGVYRLATVVKKIGERRSSW